ncbi:MAG TPA: lipocalin family protein [Tepidisphaeraceae bacterium]|nr:lipocalin family protein [Tepidisphaeraceae bacterium]
MPPAWYKSVIIYLLPAMALAGCAGHPVSSVPPTDSTIVGTWKFIKAGEQSIPFPFLIEFRSDGQCNSGPTPFALVQRSTYTFDGNKIVITYEGKAVVIANITIKNKTMTFPGDNGGEPIILTYERIWPP